MNNKIALLNSFFIHVGIHNSYVTLTFISNFVYMRVRTGLTKGIYLMFSYGVIMTSIHKRPHEIKKNYYPELYVLGD